MSKQKNPPPPTLLDGALGTLLIQRGWRRDKIPALAVFKSPGSVYKIHKEYLEAGSRMILANTFGANSVKFRHGTLQKIFDEAVSLAKNAAAGTETHVAAPIAPVGAGTPKGPKKSEALRLYTEMLTAAQGAGPHAVIFETFIRPLDIELALEAVRNIGRLPVIFSISAVKNSLNTEGLKALRKQKLPQAVIALGVNCVAPQQALKMLGQIKKFSSMPLWVKPSAGLPNKKGIYPVKIKSFSVWGAKLAKAGAQYLGGCCGTGPEYITELKKKIS